jgi:hypothetical protein
MIKCALFTGNYFYDKEKKIQKYSSVSHSYTFQSSIKEHLQNLSQQFLSYYPFLREDWDGWND